MRKLRLIAFALIITFGMLAGLVWQARFETVRTWLDHLSGDGSADPYTPQLHARIKVFLIASSLFAAMTSAVVIWFWRSVDTHLEFRLRARRTVQAWGEVLAGNSRWLIGLTVAAIALRLPYMNDPIRFDEAHSYLNYARFPFFVGISTYGDPNNHVFHTLCMHLSSSLFGNAEWALRLPAFLAGVLLVPVTLLAGVAVKDRTTGIAAASLVLVSSPLIEYSVLGRGYSIICLFTVLELIVAVHILRRHHGWEWFMLVVFSSLGLWTVPSMAYANVLVWGWLLAEIRLQIHAADRRLFVLHWLLSFVATVALTGIFYSPIIITTGLSALTSNDYVQALGWIRFAERFGPAATETWQFLLRDVPTITLLLLLSLVVRQIAIFVSQYLRTHHEEHSNHLTLSESPGAKYTSLLSITFPVVLIVLMLVCQRVLPPPRTWLFVIPLVSLLLGASWANLIEPLDTTRRTFHWVVWFLVCILSPLNASYRTQSITNSPETGRAPDAEQVVELLMQDESNGPIIAISPVSSPVVYYAIRHNMHMSRFVVPTPESLPNAVVLVSHEHKQSPFEVLDALGIENPNASTQYRAARKLHTVTIYQAK